MTSIAYLSSLCTRWGGRLELLSPRRFEAVSLCVGHSMHPSSFHAIDRKSRAIFANSRAASPGSIIHEMGHVFLDEGDLDITYEPDWLGWEIALARKARCFREWSKQNSDYDLEFEGDHIRWGEVPEGALRRRLIAERIDYAMSLGIVSRKGEPLCTRGLS